MNKNVGNQLDKLLMKKNLVFILFELLFSEQLGV